MRSVYALLSVSILFIFSTPHVLAAQPGGHLNIEEVAVSVGDPDTTIEISGTDFEFGEPLEVTLAGVPAIVTSSTDTTIIATVLTASYPAGDYLLNVSTGNGQSQNDEYDLTIGAVGPAGPAGADGEAGPPGPPGAAGLPGSNGVDGADGVDGTNGLDGTNGTDGADGLPGAAGAAGAQGIPGFACWDLNGNGTEDVATEDFNGDGVVDVNDCKGDQVINLTVEIPEVPGIVADDFIGLFPDAANNIALLEISGYCTGPVVVVNGPAFEIQIVPGFDGADPDDNAGLATELPLVIEAFDIPPGDGTTGGCSPTDIERWVTDHADFGADSDIILLTTTASGSFGAEWRLTNFVPDGSGVPGFDGRTRYTFVHPGFPDNTLDIDRISAFFDSFDAINPATDKQIFISSEFVGQYPAFVSEDADLRLTLVWDFEEAGSMFDWARRVSENGTSGGGVLKSTINLTDLASGGGGSPPSADYTGCFPSRWEQRGGFGQEIKLQDYLVIECDTKNVITP